MRRPYRNTFGSAAIATIVAVSSVASGGYLPIVGGPAWTAETGGYRGQYGQVLSHVNSFGSAVGNGFRYGPSATYLGPGAFLWNPSGQTINLGLLGTDAAGRSNLHVYAINSSGLSVGTAYKYDAASALKGQRAVRWDANGQVLELPNLGTLANGGTSGKANGINDAGVSVGGVRKYDVDGEDQGNRAVRWNSSGTVVTELGLAWTSPNAIDSAQGLILNIHNVAAGTQSRFDSTGYYLGEAAVRWDSAGNAVELDRLDNNALGTSSPSAINDAGTIVGSVAIYDDKGFSLGGRPVRWNANTTSATPLDVLGVGPMGETSGGASDINDAGVIVGTVWKYGATIGPRAVRWDATGTAVHELQTFGTDAGGQTYSSAFDVNNADIAVGYARVYDDPLAPDTEHAVYWRTDGTAVDLNKLINPNSGWDLKFANSISDTGWIAGEGVFDPDGVNCPLTGYIRSFLMQVPETAVPEPTTFGAVMIAGAIASQRRHRIK